MLHKQFLFIYTLLVLLTFQGMQSDPRTITQNDMFQTQQLKQYLQVLRGHLQDTIEKIDHNIKTRQTETEIQTPDGEYLEAALGSQRNDLIGAAAIPQTPLPLQNVRKSQNSGLRR